MLVRPPRHQLKQTKPVNTNAEGAIESVRINGVNGVLACVQTFPLPKEKSGDFS